MSNIETPFGIRADLGAAAPPAYDPLPTAPIEGGRELWTSVEWMRALGVDGGRPDAQLLAAIQMASRFLWHQSGRRYGLSRRVVRPRMDRCCGACRIPPPPTFNTVTDPARAGAAWPSRSCHHYDGMPGVEALAGGRGCSCGDRHRLRLPGTVAAIEAVWIDGEWHPGTDVQIERDRRHVRWVDDRGWPCSNDRARAPQQQWPPVLHNSGSDMRPGVTASWLTTDEGPLPGQTVDDDGVPVWVRQYLDSCQVTCTPDTTVSDVVTSGAAADWALAALRDPALGYAVVQGAGAAWFQDLLEDCDLAIVWGRLDCERCCVNGKDRDALGRYYVCTCAVSATTGTPGGVWRAGCERCTGVSRATRMCDCRPVVVPAVAAASGEACIEIQPSGAWALDDLLRNGDRCGTKYNGVAPAASTAPVSRRGSTAGVHRSTAAKSTVIVGGDDTTTEALTRYGSSSDLAYDPTRPTAWSIAYWVGRHIPAEARTVAALLASRIVGAMPSNDGCTIPAGLKSLNRDGVSMTFASSDDMTEWMKSGRTGIANVDLWLTTVGVGSGGGGRTRIVDPLHRRRDEQWVIEVDRG